MLKVVIGFITVCIEHLSFMLLNFSPLLIANYWNFAASFSVNQINLFGLYCKSRFIQVNRSWRREKKIMYSYNLLLKPSNFFGIFFGIYFNFNTWLKSSWQNLCNFTNHS